MGKEIEYSEEEDKFGPIPGNNLVAISTSLDAFLPKKNDFQVNHKKIYCQKKKKTNV